MGEYPLRVVPWVVGLLLILLLLGGVAAASPTSITMPGVEEGTSAGVPNATDIATNSQDQTAPVTNETKRCIACHEDNHPGMVEQFKRSAHYDAGVSCLECHGANESEPTAENHFESVISPLATPNDCEDCHAEEVDQFQNSLHDEAAFFSASAFSNTDTGTEVMPTGWNDNIYTHNSRASAEQGCTECHGANLKVLNDKHPNQAEEDIVIQGHPNQGMGRLNPDGSVGSCAACHPQHRFSIEQARTGSAACEECHLGPDHPQTELYEETKHSSMFHASEDEFNLSVESDELSTDDVTAPTCAICHMSGLGDVESTHDVSSRLKWEAEPVFSWPTSKKYETGRERFPIDETVARFYEDKYDLEEGTIESVPTGAPNPFATLETHRPDLYETYVVEDEETYPDINEGEEPTRWDAYDGESHISAEVKRQRMKKVCTECHTEQWVNSEFQKRDNVIDIYNAVYTAAGEKYYVDLEGQAVKAEPYGQSWVDSVYYEMWHHEGRRWRMGALMNAQDWEHWEGSYLVKNDVLKLAHFESVYENTDAGQNQTAVGNGEEVDEISPTDEATTPTQSIREKLPTGMRGVGLGAIGTALLLGAPIAGFRLWRTR